MFSAKYVPRTIPERVQKHLLDSVGIFSLNFGLEKMNQTDPLTKNHVKY